MPGLKELNNFRNNLQNIAKEADVVTQWKERYEDYPYPENPPLPDVDVDDLLGGIETPPTSNQETQGVDETFSSTSSTESDDSLNSLIDGINDFGKSLPPDDLGSIDLPHPDIFSMPTDLDFANLPSSDDFQAENTSFDSVPIDDEVQDTSKESSSLSQLQEEPERKTRKGKIDLDKWNKTQDEEPISNIEKSLSDDFLPPFDESIEDDSNETNFLDENNEEPMVNDIDLSQFDFGDDATELDSSFSIPSMEDSSIEEPVVEENIAPSIDEIEVPSLDEEEGITTENDDYPKDEITNDLSADEISSIDNIQDDDKSIDLSEFDPDEFGKIEDDEEIKDADINNSDVFSTTEPDEEIEDVQATEPEIDLSGFDFDAPNSENIADNEDIPEVPALDESKDENEPLEEFENDDNPISPDISSDEEIPSLDDVEDAEQIPTLEDDGIEEIEDAEPIDELDELSEYSKEGESIGDLSVEDVGEALSPAEDDSDNMLPLSNAELDAMDALGIQDEPETELDSESEDINLYTEPEDELEELDNSTALGVAKPKQDVPSEFDSFANIDISPSGEEANIDEHSSFTISNNILDESISDTVGGFSVPDDYSQFSQGGSSYSGTQSKEKSEENIALSITEDEYQHLLDRISSFPLNVRLEIEDYLAHNDDTTISKMEFVHLIISGAKLKKIAAKLSEILEKPIPVPKGFERKTAEEYEAEKQSFKYKLRHKIIPFATIAGIILLLTSCICFLFWTFVYIPIVSETIYNKGYTLLEQNKYSEAVQEFNSAGEYKKKKRWYFKYANGFRNKKQFQLAEDIYRRLLFDFNHDKKGGLEYVSMLRDELHNYEKAETVLKRSVLDYHVNDEQALVSLGDTYLEWARENPEKYEKARQTYSSLINMYGRKDSFLSRMMKYFIRTDKLVEVLPLKEYFMKRMKKLDIEDLTELGSYLITKRYENNIEDDEAIKNIDDVREVLEAPLKKDKNDANANYNMGRFFLYNRKFDVAQHYLAKSIDTYKNTNNLSSGSIMNSIDARRLYGEILSENKEYLQAQEMYADALSSYQEYSSSRLTSPNKTIGKLYSDYADINYFISGDLGKALQAYTMAISHMNDTPSIKYKVGYIYYQNKNYEDAMKYFSLVHTEKQDDKNLLYGLGNTLYKRGSYYVAQAYYERLMEMLEAEKIRKNVLLPHSRPDHNAFINEYMQATNNLAVILNKLAMQDGSSEKNGRAMALFGESSRAWDALTRNPETMVASKTVSLAYLNIQNIIKPQTAFETEIYSDIPKTLENETILTKDVDR